MPNSVRGATASKVAPRKIHIWQITNEQVNRRRLSPSMKREAGKHRKTATSGKLGVTGMQVCQGAGHLHNHGHVWLLIKDERNIKRLHKRESSIHRHDCLPFLRFRHLTFDFSCPADFYFHIAFKITFFFTFSFPWKKLKTFPGFLYLLFGFFIWFYFQLKWAAQT